MQKKDIITRIKADIPVTEYLVPSQTEHGKYICPYCGSGGNGHNNTSALKVYQDTNTFYCFACNNDSTEKRGSVIDAYMQAARVDFNQAVSLLAGDLGISMDERPTAADATPPAAHEAVQGNAGTPQSDFNGAGDKLPDGEEKPAQIADFTAYYKECQGRINDPAAVSYLSARGISLATAAAYGVGYDPAADVANAPGALEADAVYKPFPTPRIITPTTTAHYVGRSIDPNTPKAYAKLNPAKKHGAGSPGITNAAAIYGGANTVYICEGAFDAMSVAEAGAAAIALNSKNNGRALLAMLQNRPANVGFVVCFDNESDPEKDKRTKADAAQLVTDLRQQGYDAMAYNICGPYHDPNDALVADRAGFLGAIRAAERVLHPDALRDFMDKIQSESYKPISTGLSFFDDLLGGGVEPQTLTLLLAAPGTGKTTLCGQLAEAMAEHRKAVVYLNIEMSTEQMLSRAFSAKAYSKGRYYTAKQVRHGYNWTDSDRQFMAEVEAEYRRRNFPYIEYNPRHMDGRAVGGDLDRILEYLKMRGERARRSGKPGPAVILDYMHLVSSTRGLDLQELIKQTITGLKQYAVDYNTFVICISAVNRSSAKGGRIGLYSGRDSSNIEYTGDYVLTLDYLDIDRGNVDPEDQEAVAKLQKGDEYGVRTMVLRQPKGRDDNTGSKRVLYYKAAYNTFYDEFMRDFIPSDDYARTPFEAVGPEGEQMKITQRF